MRLEVSAMNTASVNAGHPTAESISTQHPGQVVGLKMLSSRMTCIETCRVYGREQRC